MSEWGRFLAELDRRIAKAERDDPARAERLKAMRPRLRAVDPAEGERRLDEVAETLYRDFLAWRAEAPPVGGKGGPT